MRASGLACAWLMVLGCGGDGSTKPAADGSVVDTKADAATPSAQDSGVAGADDSSVPALDASVPELEAGAPDGDSGQPPLDAAGPELCAADTCKNGGTCSASDAGVSCSCESGWEGKICDQDVDECASTPCAHATACENQVGSYACDCESGWFGKNCDVFCDDAKAETTDTLHPIYGCAHRTQDWTRFDSGLYADHLTGLGWWHNPGAISYAEVKLVCAALELSGLSDFRLPTINEARSLGGDCAPTAPDGTCPIADPACLDEDCGYGVSNECSSCIGGSGGTATHPSGGYCRPDVTLCGNWWTSSVCTDCLTEQVWFYGVTNGNFYHDAPTGGRGGACVTTLTAL